MTRTHTTRYVTLLSVVLALALTAALVACGSDEPVRRDSPRRDRVHSNGDAGLPRTDAYHDRFGGCARRH